MANDSLFGTFFKGKGGKWTREEDNGRLLQESVRESVRAEEKQAGSAKQEAGAMDRLTDRLKDSLVGNQQSNRGGPGGSISGPLTGSELRAQHYATINTQIQAAQQQLDMNRVIRERRVAQELAPGIEANIRSRDAKEEAWRPINTEVAGIKNQIGTGWNNLQTWIAEAVINSVPGAEARVQAMREWERTHLPVPRGWNFLHWGKGDKQMPVQPLK
jgi:hypothetical protein